MRPSLAVAYAVLLAGCSVDGTGFARRQTVQGEGVVVVRTASYGASLFTGAGREALVLGAAEVIELFPDRPGPEARGPATLAYERVGGIKLAFNRSAIGLQIGLGSALWLQPIAAGASVVRQIHFAPDRLAETRLKLCRGACE